MWCKLRKNVTWIIAIVELTVNVPRLPSSSVNSLVTQRTRIPFTGLGASVAIFMVSAKLPEQRSVFTCRCQFLNPERECHELEL